MIIQCSLKLLSCVRRSNFCCGVANAIGQVTAAGISSAASIVNTNNINKANKDIARETNQMNYDIHREDNQFNHNESMLSFERERRLIADERAYESPSAQRQRMLDAGYNPIQALGGISSSGGSSVSAPPAASAAASPDMEAAHMQTTDFSSLEDVGKVALAYLQGQQINEGINYNKAKTEGQILDNKKSLFDLEKLPDRWQNEEEAHDWLGKQVKIKMAQLFLTDRHFRSEEARNYAESYYLNALKEQVDTKTNEMAYNLEFAKKTEVRRIKTMDEQINNIRANTSNLYAQAEQARANADLMRSETDLNDIDKTTRDARNKAEIHKQVSETLYLQIRSCTELQSADFTEQEKTAIAAFLATHPDVSTSELFSALKQCEASPRKDFSRSFKKDIWDFAKALMVGGAAGIITGNPIIGVLAGSSVLGANTGFFMNPQQGPKSYPVIPGTTVPNLAPTSVIP